ncbi:MAG: aldehyde dehydrogenase family protein [Ilumatobacteraceae bacterium]
MSPEYQVGDRIVGGNFAHVVNEVEVALLNAGAKIIVLSDRIVVVDSHIAQRCAEGVGRAEVAFGAMAGATDQQITSFFEAFELRLAQDRHFEPVLAANSIDLENARSRGRAVGRLEITPKMRSDMIESARMWAQSAVRKEVAVEQVQHRGWSVEKVASPLGVVAFVFEGRPNVCVDATGVLRTGNTCVFRIGSDALGTAQAIMKHCLTPALVEAGLPQDAVVLLDEAERSAGFALFSDRRISLAVARGSGEAVRDLGYVAQSNGIATSLHGTGGAWMILGDSVDANWFAETLVNSIDRKVCNTLNVCCVPRSRERELMSVLAKELRSVSAQRGKPIVVHTVGENPDAVRELLCPEIEVLPARVDELSTEWEWDAAPEFFVVATDSIEESFALCNRYSPQFVVSVLSGDPLEHQRAWNTLNAPFVGNGFTRWVDGQYALGKPELGLSNWEQGRALGRGGILSGDDIRTFRFRMVQKDSDVHR